LATEKQISNGASVGRSESTENVLYLFVLVGKGFEICAGLELKEVGHKH
jgi:hypothetical protein